MMKSMTDFLREKDYELYHVRYGRGAIIVCIEKRRNEPLLQRKQNSDFYVASIFSSRTQELDDSSQKLDPIESIREQDGFVIMTLYFERRSRYYPSYRPIMARIKRILPVEQISIEVVESNMTSL